MAREGRVVLKISEFSAATQEIGILAVALLLSMIASFTAIRLGFFRSLEKKPLAQRISFSLMLGAFASYFLSQLITLIAASFYLMLKADSIWNWQLHLMSAAARRWFIVAGLVLAYLSVVGFYLLQNSRTRDLIWQRGKKFKSAAGLNSFFFGVASWAFAYPVAFFVDEGISLLIYFSTGVSKIEQVPVTALKKLQGYPFIYLSMCFSMIVFVPVMEELLFRGFLQTWLRGKMRLFPAIAIASAVFALFHFNYSQGLSNIHYIAALSLLSVFLGYLYEREKNLWAPTGLHMMFNGFNIFILSFF